MALEKKIYIGAIAYTIIIITGIALRIAYLAHTGYYA